MTPAYVHLGLLVTAGMITLAVPTCCHAQGEGLSAAFTPAFGMAMARLAPTPATFSEEGPPSLDIVEAGHKGVLGLAIGGVGMGLVGGLLGHALCTRYSSDPNDSCTGEALVGVGVGAVIGAGFGYLIGKRSKTPP